MLTIKNILDSDKFLMSIRGDKSTEFHGKDGNETGSIIDYMFITPAINLVRFSYCKLYKRGQNTKKRFKR